MRRLNFTQSFLRLLQEERETSLMMWRIDGGLKPSYILGSMHIVSLYNLPDVGYILEKLRDSDFFASEIVFSHDDADEPGKFAAMYSHLRRILTNPIRAFRRFRSSSGTSFSETAPPALVDATVEYLASHPRYPWSEEAAEFAGDKEWKKEVFNLLLRDVSPGLVATLILGLWLDQVAELSSGSDPDAEDEWGEFYKVGVTEKGDPNYDRSGYGLDDRLEELASAMGKKLVGLESSGTRRGDVGYDLEDPDSAAEGDPSGFILGATSTMRDLRRTLVLIRRVVNGASPSILAPMGLVDYVRGKSRRFRYRSGSPSLRDRTMASTLGKYLKGGGIFAVVGLTHVASIRKLLTRYSFERVPERDAEIPKVFNYRGRLHFVRGETPQSIQVEDVIDGKESLIRKKVTVADPVPAEKHAEIPGKKVKAFPTGPVLRTPFWQDMPLAASFTFIQAVLQESPR